MFNRLKFNPFSVSISLLFSFLFILCHSAQSVSPEKNEFTQTGRIGLQERFLFPFQEATQAKSLQTQAVHTQAPSPSELSPILEDFEQYAVQAMADWEIPGMAIAIVQNDEVVYLKSFGVKELGRPDPVTIDTVFHIGSASKAFTSLLVAMMEKEGHFTWKDPVISHLPDFKLNDPWVTREFQIRDLMSQHSGLSAYSLIMAPFFHFDRQQVRSMEQYIKPITSFRSEFAYQNALFLDAAALLEIVSGKTWEQLLQERIFTPLGMTNTSSTLEGLLTSPNRTLGHYRMDSWAMGEILPVQPDWPYIDWVYIYGPAGSIACSITDLTKWVRLHLNQGTLENQQLIDADALEYTHIPHTIIHAPVSGSQKYYAQGWLYQTYDPYNIIWHNGGTLSGTAMVSFVPEANLGFVLVANLADANIGDALHLAFYDRYFGKETLMDWNRLYLENAQGDIEEQQPPEWPQNPSPPTDLNNLTGYYANPSYGTISVILDNSDPDSLILSIGPKGQTIPLKHWDGNAFMTSIPQYMNYAGITTFQLDSNGKPLSMSVELLNSDEGFGEFLRVENQTSIPNWSHFPN